MPLSLWLDEPPVVGGGEWVAPWHVEAVQPVRGQVIVPEPLESAAPVDEPIPAWAVLLLIAWQVEDEHPVVGQM